MCQNILPAEYHLLFRFTFLLKSQVFLCTTTFFEVKLLTILFLFLFQNFSFGRCAELFRVNLIDYAGLGRLLSNLHFSGNRFFLFEHNLIFVRLTMGNAFRINENLVIEFILDDCY